ncbi:hypothetical protein Tco_0688344 [Tanacetum coccineum]
MPVSRIELTEYAVLFGKKIRRLDSKTQYAVLIRRFDTSYLTGRYRISGDHPRVKTNLRENDDSDDVTNNDDDVDSGADGDNEASNSERNDSD